MLQSDIGSYTSDLRIAGFSPTTIETYVGRLRNVPFKLPGTMRQVKDFLAQRQDEVKLSSVVVEIRALRSFSRWWADEYNEPDPLVTLKYPKLKDADPGKIADNDDVVTLVESIKNSRHRNSQRDLAIVLTFATTGMRRSELCRLRLADVDLTERRIYIQAGKNGQGRTVPIHTDLLRPLRQWINQDRSKHHKNTEPELFLGRYKALNPDSITTILRRVSQEAKLDEPISSHQFRRRMAREWVTNSGSDDALALICGWRTLAMPARYRKEAVGELANAQYERIFESKSEEQSGPKPGRRSS